MKDSDVPAPIPELVEVEDLPEAVKRSKADGRLIIKSIELTNFKSYLGTRMIGPFHKVYNNNQTNNNFNKNIS